MLEKGTIIEHRQVARDIFLLTFSAPGIATVAKAGQFVHIRCGKTLDPLLRRPFSFSNINRGAGTCSVIYEIRGRGTQLLADFVVGDEIDLLGPLGTHFSVEKLLPEAHAILVGGGIGAPPMAALAQALSHREIAKVTVLLGAATRDKLVPESIFETVGAKVLVATNDGSKGHHGFVTELLDSVVEADMEAGLDGDNLLTDNSLLAVFACGPNGMLKAVRDYCLDRNIPCQISLEEIMACGVGACQGCVCKVKAEGSEGDTGQGFEYVRVCTEGPVFEAGEVVWDE